MRLFDCCWTPLFFFFLVSRFAHSRLKCGTGEHVSSLFSGFRRTRVRVTFSNIPCGISVQFSFFPQFFPRLFIATLNRYIKSREYGAVDAYGAKEKEEMYKHRTRRR